MEPKDGRKQKLVYKELENYMLAQHQYQLLESFT